ncbi:ATP-binding protein, partial [Snuella lapsa]|uniref:ATP-binding protein n=1 Tax=Snuella lapsa TaxID=870481 RepID=UPI0031EA83A9
NALMLFLIENTEKKFLVLNEIALNGSGVGLSLSKQIMLLHNGKIQIKSKEHVGTSVQLFL